MKNDPVGLHGEESVRTMACILCGETSYAPSLGGPHICPACDAGVFHDPALATKRMLGLKPPPVRAERTWGPPESGSWFDGETWSSATRQRNG